MGSSFSCYPLFTLIGNSTECITQIRGTPGQSSCSRRTAGRTPPRLLPCFLRLVSGAGVCGVIMQEPGRRNPLAKAAINTRLGGMHNPAAGVGSLGSTCLSSGHIRCFSSFLALWSLKDTFPELFSSVEKAKWGLGFSTESSP